MPVYQCQGKKLWPSLRANYVTGQLRKIWALWGEKWRFLSQIYWFFTQVTNCSNICWKLGSSTGRGYCPYDGCLHY